MSSNKNMLYYGDNLDILSSYLGKDSVDLVYLDPPFNSQRTYNLMYHRFNGTAVPEQVEAFSDTWRLDEERETAARALPIVMRAEGVDNYYIEFWRLWVNALRKTQPHLLAYLVYIVHRLLYLKSALRPTGSIYLHCDPHASHYLKVMMDGIFGHENFRNELVWKRTFAHGGASKWGDVHDTILFYSKTNKFTWNRELQPLDDGYVNSKYRYQDDRGRFRYVVLTAPGIRDGESGRAWMGYDPTAVGRHWAVPKRATQQLAQEGIRIPPSSHEQLDVLFKHGFIRFGERRGGGRGAPEVKHYLNGGQPLQDVITDIPPINSQSDERLGYPTQKPIALLERIIRASSNPGDVVFDPFCGCGTTIYAATKNDRRWIGCDIAILPLRIVTGNLLSRYGLQEGIDFQVLGVPASVEQAYDLYERDRAQFEHWVIETLGGFPLSDTTKTYGEDGVLFYERFGETLEMPIRVKSAIKPADIRAASQTLTASNDVEYFGLVSLEEISRPADLELDSFNADHRRPGYPDPLQALTIRQIIEQKHRFKAPGSSGSALIGSQPSFL